MRNVLSLLWICFFLWSCFDDTTEYVSFAGDPGFSRYYKGKCRDSSNPRPAEGADRELLLRYRPRWILPPGNYYPVDFYREYLPHTVLRRYPDKNVIEKEVTPHGLRRIQHNRHFYLDFQLDRFQEAGLGKKVGEGGNGKGIKKREFPVYGRIIHEEVSFPCEGERQCFRDYTFLKYNILFPISGLPAGIHGGYELLLDVFGFDPDNWHELDNFVAVHIVLNEREDPVAVLLNQHEYSRTYVIGKDIPLPPDNRVSFDIAIRSNEAYPASDAENPVQHRVVKDMFDLAYLLGGDTQPLFSGYDITRGVNAGGEEVPSSLLFLSPCDPLYTASIVLGELRPFFGRYTGRDGPNGADYYTIPQLLPLGRLLQFSYLEDGKPEDIRLVEEAIDRRNKFINIEQIIDYGGSKLLRDLEISQEGSNRR